MSKWVEDTLRIRGKDISVKLGQLPIMDLKFFSENPRVYSMMWSEGEGAPDQEEIFAKLRKFDHVKELMQDIKENDGLIEPIIVQDGSYEVLEGNRRLAASRMLHEKDAIKWGKIKVCLLPRDVAEEDVFALLGQFHVKGRLDWVPFEQAGFLYRRFKKHNLSKSQLAREIGLSPARVGTLINTYQFMLDNGITDTSRWSHCEVFKKSPGIRKVAKKFPEIEARFISDLNHGRIREARDIRDKLGKIDKAPVKVQKAYAQGTISLEDAYERTEDSGGTNEVYRRLSTFREWLVRPEVLESVRRIDFSAAKKVGYEVTKIDKRLREIRREMNA